MAGFKTHTAGGVIAAAAVYGLFAAVLIVCDFPYLHTAMQSLKVKAGLASVAVFFALWPDIDTNSVVHELFYGLVLLADIILIVAKFYVPASLLGLFAMIPMLGKHRGWTHSRLAMLLVPLPLLAAPAVIRRELVLTGLPWYIAGVAGYASHLVLDGKRR